MFKCLNVTISTKISLEMRFGNLLDELAKLFLLVVVHLIERVDEFLPSVLHIFQKFQTAGLPIVRLQKRKIIFVFRLAETIEYDPRHRAAIARVNHRFRVFDQVLNARGNLCAGLVVRLGADDEIRFGASADVVARFRFHFVDHRLAIG